MKESRVAELQKKLDDLSNKMAERLLMFDADDDMEETETFSDDIFNVQGKRVVKSSTNEISTIIAEAKKLGYDVISEPDGLYNKYSLVERPRL